MLRVSALALVAAFVFVQICCAPPVRAAAFEMAEAMQCPIQKQKCDTTETADCSGGPQLLADGPVVKSAAVIHFQPVALATQPPVPHAEPEIHGGWWSAPTRTIQLRI